MKKTDMEHGEKADRSKAGTASDARAARTVVLPPATAAQQRGVSMIRDWEDRSERSVLAGLRVRSK